MHAGTVNSWDAELYDGKMFFVSKFGEGILSLLNPQKGEKVIDLGCGTGDLTMEIAKRGAIPIGIDSSPSMIEKARDKYVAIPFLVDRGETFRTVDQFDAVFSNAALHWMLDASAVVESIWLALRPGGRFVAEFGGKGNVQTIIDAIEAVLLEQGLVAGKNPWYLPSVGEYSTLLEQHGFRVVYAAHFDRPTVLDGGEHGLRHWLDMFAGNFFVGLADEQKQILYDKVISRAKPDLWQSGTWIADYKRLQVIALKPC